MQKNKNPLRVDRENYVKLGPARRAGAVAFFTASQSEIGTSTACWATPLRIRMFRQQK